jgi:hypothetical protein
MLRKQNMKTLSLFILVATLSACNSNKSTFYLYESTVREWKKSNINDAVVEVAFDIQDTSWILDKACIYGNFYQGNDCVEQAIVQYNSETEKQELKIAYTFKLNPSEKKTDNCSTENYLVLSQGKKQIHMPIAVFQTIEVNSFY